MRIKSDHVFLLHIRDAIDDIKSFTPKTIQELCNDRKTNLAICKSFEIIGEASTNLSEEFKSKYPQVAWKKIKNFRNHLTHEYFDIDYAEIWNIIENYLPDLEKNIFKILKETEK